MDSAGEWFGFEMAPSMEEGEKEIVGVGPHQKVPPKLEVLLVVSLSNVAKMSNYCPKQKSQQNMPHI